MSPKMEALRGASVSDQSQVGPLIDSQPYRGLTSAKISVAQRERGKIPSNTGSDEVLDRALQWISDCVQRHEKCSAIVHSDRQIDLPTRLLWVGSSADSVIRLCHTRFFPKETPYITLSHRWVSLSHTLDCTRRHRFKRAISGSVLMETEKGR
jgi:hypothetical protein